MRRSLIVASAALIAACGGQKADKAAEAAALAADSTARADSAAAATAKANTDSMTKMMADTSGTKKAAGPMRDSAFGPKFEVDSKGKVTPIKKTP